MSPCLVPGCRRMDVGTTELERIPLCGGHLRLWDSTPHGTDAEKWASYIALSEGVRTPLPPRELVRVGSTPVEGGFVAAYRVDSEHNDPPRDKANPPTSSEGSPSNANGVGHG